MIILIPSIYANAQEKENDIQTNNVGWISYRDAYKEMLWFEKYGGPKHFLQSKLQITYQNSSNQTIKLRLRLVGKTINLSLPLDAMNRTSLPFIKNAYDENAELILTSPSDQHISKIKFKSGISFHLRTDGIYEVGDLVQACKQALQFQNFLSATLNRKKECRGVKIIYPDNENMINVKFKLDQSTDKAITINEEQSSLEGSSIKLKSVSFLFNQATEKSQIITKTMPIAIIPISE